MAGPYRDGKVHVMRRRCATCIFRPGNLMRLEEGRVEEMVEGALREDSAITCHKTLYDEKIDEAVCYGFFREHPTQPLQVAERLDLIEYDDEPHML